MPKDAPSARLASALLSLRIHKTYKHTSMPDTQTPEPGLQHSSPLLAKEEAMCIHAVSRHDSEKLDREPC